MPLRLCPSPSWKPSKTALRSVVHCSGTESAEELFNGEFCASCAAELKWAPISLGCHALWEGSVPSYKTFCQPTVILYTEPTKVGHHAQQSHHLEADRFLMLSMEPMGYIRGMEGQYCLAHTNTQHQSSSVSGANALVFELWWVLSNNKGQPQHGYPHMHFEKWFCCFNPHMFNSSPLHGPIRWHLAFANPLFRLKEAYECHEYCGYTEPEAGKALSKRARSGHSIITNFMAENFCHISTGLPVYCHILKTQWKHQPTDFKITGYSSSWIWTTTIVLNPTISTNRNSPSDQTPLVPGRKGPLSLQDPPACGPAKHQTWSAFLELTFHHQNHVKSFNLRKKHQQMEDVLFKNPRIIHDGSSEHFSATNQRSPFVSRFCWMQYPWKAISLVGWSNILQFSNFKYHSKPQVSPTFTQPPGRPWIFGSVSVPQKGPKTPPLRWVWTPQHLPEWRRAIDPWPHG